MTQAATPIATFFSAFQRNNAAGTEGDILSQFAETFLAAGPDGARPVPAAAFAPALAKRKQLFEQLGHSSTELVSLEETPLDGRYTLARTRWRMTFIRPDHPAEEVTVESTFLIDTHSEHILVYLAHQDIFATLRQRGIMAD